MADQEQPSKVDLAVDELRSLPEGKAEQVLHHARQLKHTPEDAATSAVAHEERPEHTDTHHVWRCMRCGATLPRTDEHPDACPECGAPREELAVIKEA